MWCYVYAVSKQCACYVYIVNNVQCYVYAVSKQSACYVVLGLGHEDAGGEADPAHFPQPEGERRLEVVEARHRLLHVLVTDEQHLKTQHSVMSKTHI